MVALGFMPELDPILVSHDGMKLSALEEEINHVNRVLNLNTRPSFTPSKIYD